MCLGFVKSNYWLTMGATGGLFAWPRGLAARHEREATGELRHQSKTPDPVDCRVDCLENCVTNQRLPTPLIASKTPDPVDC
jgi:hypothetical protein